jgi:hypothetical protein
MKLTALSCISLLSRLWPIALVHSMLITDAAYALVHLAAPLIDGFIKYSIVSLTDSYQLTSLKCFPNVVEGPPGPLNFILKLFYLDGQLPLEFTHFFLRVHLPRDELFLQMSHHGEEPIIKLVLVLYLLEVLLEDALLEFDLLLANYHLIRLWEHF